MLIMDHWLLSLPLQTNHTTSADGSHCQNLLGDLSTCKKIMLYYHLVLGSNDWKSLRDRMYAELEKDIIINVESLEWKFLQLCPNYPAERIIN